jgi:DsbC/DsbD-like thiol-disulfide interchange protein
MIALRTVLLLALTFSAANPALGQNSVTKIKVKSSVSKPDAKGFQEITLDVDVEKGWHIYANMPRNKEFEINKTVLRIVAPKVEDVTIDYPEGQVHKDKIDNEEITYRVYEGTVRITARLKRVETAPLELDLQVYACDNSKCLPKGNLKLKIP